MDRAPLPAPFPVGARVRYIGDRRSWFEEDGARVPIVEPGLVVTIEEARPGRRGTLRPCYEDGEVMEDESTGAPILDQTRDGYSVYRTGGRRPMGRIIWAANAGEWEVVS